MRFHIEEECYSADEAYSFGVQTYATFISNLTRVQLPLERNRIQSLSKKVNSFAISLLLLLYYDY